MQAAIGAGVEDTREVRQRLVVLEGNVVKMQRAEDKRAVEIMLKVSEQEVRAAHLPCHATVLCSAVSSYEECIQGASLAVHVFCETADPAQDSQCYYRHHAA